MMSASCALTDFIYVLISRGQLYRPSESAGESGNSRRDLHQRAAVPTILRLCYTRCGVQEHIRSGEVGDEPKNAMGGTVYLRRHSGDYWVWIGEK